MGVCTKVAIRLHPWVGPKALPTRGDAPAYKMDGLDNFKCYTLCFPDWDAYARSFQLFHENDILYSFIPENDFHVNGVFKRVTPIEMFWRFVLAK